MQFYRNYWLYFFISAFFLIPSIVALILFNFQLGIDFTGGTLMTVEASEASLSAMLTENNLRTKVGDEFKINSIKQTSEGQTIIRLAPLDSEQKATLLAQINEVTPINLISYDSVGAVLGGELIKKTLAAIVLACVFLIIYLRSRFQSLSFGVAAFLAVIHDTLIVSGIFAILGAYAGIEVDTLFVTALLTTISFSVHDTVVIYDRIRELKKRFPQATLNQVAEAAVIATISRSLNNSLTVIFMLLSLLILGGVTLSYFALALLLGVIFGTYSSPFVSVPLLLFFEEWEKVKKPKKK